MMTVMTDRHDHVSLLAGTAKDGSPRTEMTPAEKLGASRYRILGTPGLANGCAEGDIVIVEHDGSFDVIERGGNIAIHVYPAGPLGDEVLSDLKQRFGVLGGRVEYPPDTRFVAITVPSAAGFPKIEAAMDDAMRHPSASAVEWYFGNVYDDAGTPLEWWHEPSD